MTIQESNKRYKLLKDLPFAKAGEIFKRHTFESKDGLSDYDYFEIRKLKHGEVNETAFGIKRNGFIDNLDDWFEEIEDETWAINTLSSRVEEISNTSYSKWAIENLKSLGLLFSTKEEAEKHLEWLKARAVLIEDTKGFKPDWKDWDERKWRVEYNYINNCLCASNTARHDFGAIHFKSREDANESIKTHEKEWKIYLGVE